MGRDLEFEVVTLEHKCGVWLRVVGWVLVPVCDGAIILVVIGGMFADK